MSYRLAVGVACALGAAWIGSHIGIAAFGGAVSGTLIFAAIGFGIGWRLAKPAVLRATSVAPVAVPSPPPTPPVMVRNGASPSPTAPLAPAKHFEPNLRAGGRPLIPRWLLLVVATACAIAMFLSLGGWP